MHERIKEQLLERRAYLDGKLHDYEDALDQQPSKDYEDRATEREDDEVLEGLGRTGLDEIHRIDAALARIDAGTYGVCAQCGNTIPAERLEAVPHAVLCAQCAGSG